MGTRSTPVSSLPSALISSSGDPVYLAEAASASNSRDARNRHLDQHRGDRRQDHHQDAAQRAAFFVVVGRGPNQKAMRARNVIAEASVAATELVRMSRCST